jgi:outer membrane immunogenic protein
MKKFIVGSVALAATFAGPAMAADMALKAPPVAAPAYSWTGFYVGANIGYSWGKGDSNYTDPRFAIVGLPTSFSQSENLDGLIGGVQIGYNWQANNTWIFGIEADFQGSGEKGSSSLSDPYVITSDPFINQTFNAKILWFGTVRGRVGVLVNPTLLLYGTGGLAYGRISGSGTVTDTFPACSPAICNWAYGNSATNIGWTLGAGVEGAIPNTSDWTWKVEYLYIDFGSVNGSGFDPDFSSTYTWSAKVTDNIVRVGLNYRFH